MVSQRVSLASVTLAAAGAGVRLGRAGLRISGVKCDELARAERQDSWGPRQTLLPGPWDLLCELSLVRWG